MAVPVSSLSVAIQGIADFLDSQFGEDVVISVDTPQRASERAKGNNSTAHCLNLFIYRVAPSGFHADAGSDETQFIRVNGLITAFPNDSDTESDDADLRVLGHAIRVIQSNPVLPIGATPLPGPAITAPPGRKEYRLQAVMQAPPMEEINHVWTMHGGELPYRLSAAYEFALIPIEPMVERVNADPPRTAVLDTHANMDDSDTDFVAISSASRAIPLSGSTPESEPPTPWLPVQMLVDSDALTNSRAVSALDTEVQLALAGPEGEDVAVEVVWTLADGTQSSQAPQLFTLATSLLDAAAARTGVALSVPAAAQRAVINTRAAQAGVPLPESPFANALTLTVT